MQSLDQRFPKEVVALELGITPDLRWFAEQLAEPDFKRPMQVRDPSLAPFDQAHVIHVSVADEGITLKVHDFPRERDDERG